MKQLLYSILILILFSCSKDEPEKINTPPKAFEVTAKVEGTNVTLTWTDAIDADGDAVNYAVVYGADTLTKGLTTRTFTIKDLPYETEIAGTVVASDGKGGKTEQGFKVKTSGNPNVVIPDKKFEAALVALKIDDAVDGKLSRNAASKVTDLYLGKETITDLTGIEAFTNLVKLNVSGNFLKTLNLISNGKLEELNCESNRLETLYLSNDPKIKYLYIGYNKFKELDLGSFKNLLELDVSYNFTLEKINIDAKTLKLVSLEHCNFTSLEFLSEESLEYLSANNNKLNSLEISKNRKLRNLTINNNSFQNIDLSNNTELVYFEAFNNKLKEIDVSKNVKLATLHIDRNELNEINLANNTQLFSLWISENKFVVIDLTRNINLLTLICVNNQLVTLDLSKNKKLVEVNCTKNNKLSVICVNSLQLPTQYWKKDPTATYKVCD